MPSAKADKRGVANKARLGHDYLVTRRNESAEAGVNGFRSADGHEHIGFSIIFNAEFAIVIVGNFFSKL